jgi:Uma2 family endonuclease
MSTTAQKKTTPADLLAMPDSHQFELVDGELVERNVSVLSSLVASIILRLLGNYSEEKSLGIVLCGSNGYQCFPNARDKVRKPDVSFVRRERFSPDHLREGWLSIRPDLAVEVVSPNDTAYELDQKIEEYLAVGVPLVWVVNPETRIVKIHRQDGTVSKLHADAELTGENVLPSFQCKVESLFPAVKSS